MNFRYLKYLWKAKHRRGFGIHSPSLFYLITNVIEENLQYYKYGLVEQVRAILKKSGLKINVGGKVMTLEEIIKRDCKPKHLSQMLMRLAVHYKPKNILEIGTSLGLSTMYIAAADSRSKIVTIEQEKEIADQNVKNFKRAGFQNIEMICGDAVGELGNALKRLDSVDMLYIDISDADKAMRVFNETKERLAKKSFCVIGDIHESDEKEELWNKLKEDNVVRVSLDIFDFGLLIIDDELQKEHFMLLYLPWLRNSDNVQ